MSSSASGPQGSDRPFQADEDTRAEAERLAPALLEQVLQQTIASFGEGEPLAPAEREAICQVFRRHRGDAAPFEVVVVELVSTILASAFPSMTRSVRLWEETSASIARLLLADPGASRRLDALRRRLDEVP